MALFLFAAALIVVGVGYLTLTGATADIARGLLPGLVSAALVRGSRHWSCRMSTPKTLLQMAGADAGPASLATSTLVIIDAQNEYLDGKLALPGVKPATEALARLLAKARAAGAPVVHVVQKGRPGGLFDLEARGGAVIDAVKQAARRAYRAEAAAQCVRADGTRCHAEEAGTHVAGDRRLHDAHVRQLHGARRAGPRLQDHGGGRRRGNARPARPHGGGVIAADALHRAALAELADRFAIVATVDQIPGT